MTVSKTRYVSADLKMSSKCTAKNIGLSNSPQQEATRYKTGNQVRYDRFTWNISSGASQPCA